MLLLIQANLVKHKLLQSITFCKCAVQSVVTDLVSAYNTLRLRA